MKKIVLSGSLIFLLLSINSCSKNESFNHQPLNQQVSSLSKKISSESNVNHSSSSKEFILTKPFMKGFMMNNSIEKIEKGKIFFEKSKNYYTDGWISMSIKNNSSLIQDIGYRNFFVEALNLNKKDTLEVLSSVKNYRKYSKEINSLLNKK